jgi:hypothetical protein
LGIATDLTIGTPVCSGCTATAAPIGNEAVPGDEFAVTLTVDVMQTKFSVFFDIRGTPVELTLCVKDIGFGNDHLINLDTYADVADPVWQSSECGAAITEIKPVAYTSGTLVNISAVSIGAKLVPQIQKSVALDISAFGTVGFSNVILPFKFARVSVPGAGGTVAIGSATTSVPTEPARARATAFFTIDWKYVFITDDSSNLKPIQTTGHTAYFTYKDPLVTPLYLTVLDHTTQGASEGMNDSGVIAGIWSEFTDRIVKKRTLNTGTGFVTVNPATPAFTYYATAGCNAQYVTDILASGDGQCGAWARYLQYALGIHGINSSVVEILPPVSASGLLVKNWNIIDGPGHCTAGYPYFEEADLTNLAGIPGQGIGTPARKRFSNHALVATNNQFYDPSYGTGPFSLDVWEEQSIEGFYRDELGGACVRKNDLGVRETRIGFVGDLSG